MRIALQFEIPTLLQGILKIAPQADIVTLSPDTPLEQAGPVDVVLATPDGAEQLARLLEVSRHIKWVHILGSVGDYPLELLAGRLVTCSKGATASPIAEWVMAMILAHAKRIPGSWIDKPPAQWFTADFDTLEGKTLGIIGFGQIGQAIARRALAFDMEVLATVRSFRPSCMPGVELLKSVDELIPRADHLVLALPATAQSAGLLNARRLSEMKAGSHLINISRAILIDHIALREMLDKEHIARASLDVAHPEPLPRGHWLYEHPRIKLSPHTSWNAPLSHERIFHAFFDNLHRWLEGEKLQGVVDTAAGY